MVKITELKGKWVECTACFVNQLILFPGINNRLRESSINEALSRINRQEER